MTEGYLTISNANQNYPWNQALPKHPILKLKSEMIKHFWRQSVISCFTYSTNISQVPILLWHCTGLQNTNVIMNLSAGEEREGERYTRMITKQGVQQQSSKMRRRMWTETMRFLKQVISESHKRSTTGGTGGKGHAGKQRAWRNRERTVFWKRKVAQNGCRLGGRKIKKMLAHQGKCVLLESLDFQPMAKWHILKKDPIGSGLWTG